MLLTIHDANLQKVAFIDNNKQETLNYYDDVWTRSLETGSSTFEFTVYKKAIKSDTTSNKTYNLLNERAFISFRYNGKSYVFNVMTVEENEQTIKCYCENLNLELINEYANPFKATKAMSFVEYCNAMDLLNFTYLSIGINEISDKKRTLEWEGQDTKLARLLSLANKFDAEIDFDTQLNADSSIKAFKVNVYHENDESHQGVGRVRNDIQLTYGKNLKSITRKIDKTGIYNAIRPTGKRTVKNSNGEEVEEIVTIGSLSAWSENNKDGVREFYQQGDFLYAPLSMQMYPSTFTSSTTNDQWIRKDIEVESDSPSVIRAAAIANLRKNAYPALTYEVYGFVDAEIGDTIKIYDDGFSPILLVQARVSHQKVSFTNPTSNQTTFANFKALENNLSDGIQAAFERLFEASKPYAIRLSTDNGTVFKNGQGQSTVSPTLLKGGKVISTDVSWRWALGDVITTGMTYTIRANQINQKAVLIAAAYIGNTEVARHEIDVINVDDGRDGEHGRSSYPHIAYAKAADIKPLNQNYDFSSGLVGWSKLGTINLNETSQTVTTQGNGIFYQPPSSNTTTSSTSDYKILFKARTIQSESKTIRVGYVNVGKYKDIPLDNAFSEHEFILKDVPANQNFHIIFNGAFEIDYAQICLNSAKYVDLSTEPSDDRPYMGIYTDDQETIVLDPALFKWSLIKGPKGALDETQVREINDKIDGKADQALTQEQQNLLNEKMGLMQAELEAKASLATVTQWFDAYQNFVKANEAAKVQAEQDLVVATQRIIAVENNLINMSERWNFIDTFMSIQNEGLIIGKNDGSSSAVFSDDRISFISAGKEVAYFSAGALQVDNGVFTKTIQIGRFREEQYHNNPDINVKLYVGGQNGTI